MGNRDYKIQEKLAVISKTKDLKNVFYSSSKNFSKDTKSILNKMRKIPKTETKPSLVAYYLLGDNSFDISFI